MTRTNSTLDHNNSLRWSRRFAMLLAAPLLLALAFVGGDARAADDDPPGRVGRVTASQGQSWLYDSEADEWITLQHNRPIASGNRVAVDGPARLELRVGSTTVRLAGGSELEIRRLDDERIELFLIGGSAALRVRSQDVAREIEIATEQGRFAPRRAGHYRIDQREGNSIATVWSGDLHFENDDSALDIGNGRSAEFWRERGATHYSWAEAQSDEFADWVARANREDDRSGAVTRYVSPEMTGYEDLDRNGRWESHPEYGPLWLPTTVVAGWAPYRYGHWVWVRPWGWTWVDDAPWGFAPFHYGRWVVVGGRWCWAPGRYVRRPVYAPALVAWIGNTHVVAGAPVVGWVPLAPREPYYPHYARGGGYWKAVNSAHLHLFPANTPRSVPTRAIMYANQRAPGGVSAVSSSVLGSRRPIAPAVAEVDPGVRNSLGSRAWRPHVPPPGVARTIAVPSGGATAIPPGTAPAVRPGVRPPGSSAQPPAAAVGSEPRERVPRPGIPPQAGIPPQPGTAAAPQVRSNVLPQLQTAPPAQTNGQSVPPRAAAQPVPPRAQPLPPGVQPRRIEPGEGPGTRREPAATPPPQQPPAAPPPGVRRAPIPAPEVNRAPEPPRREVRPPPARAPLPAQPPAQREIQREIQRDQRELQRERGGREPEARVRTPESRTQPGRNQMQ